MTRSSPLVRVSLGLVLVTCSILVLMDIAGLLPAAVDQRVVARVRLCETLAAQTAAAAGADDLNSARAALYMAVARNEELESAALRAATGRLLIAEGNHAERWDPSVDANSSPTHISIPLLKNGKPWASLEVRFREETARGALEALWGRPLMRVLVLMSLTGFFAYLGYMRRTLRHLDPSSVIPARVQAALDAMAGGVLLLDQSERIVLANAAFVETFGENASSLMGRRASTLAWSRSDGNYRMPWAEALDGAETVEAHMFLEDVFGDRRSLVVRCSPVLDGWDRAKGVIANFDDVTELERKTMELEEALATLEKSQEEIKQQNQELEFLAHHDPLTGASNRRFFMERFGGEFNAEDRQVCCVMVDIDHFKKVNDEHGHQMGDEVIRRVSEALMTEVRSNDNVCRYGGEEFCLVLQDTDVLGAATAAERIRTRIDSPGFARVPVTASFGVSSIQFGATSLNTLIEQADQALYASKNNGRNQISIWKGKGALERFVPRTLETGPNRTGDSE